MPRLKGNNSPFLIFLLLFIFACKPTAGPIVEPVVNEAPPFEEVANTVIKTSFETLSSSLTSAVKEKGIVEAIAFCKLNANPIVDSLSQHYSVAIKRTSLQLRNEMNAPSNDEVQVLNFFKDHIEEQMEFGDQMREVNGTQKYFKPIYVTEGCLKCHGKAGEGLNEMAKEKILELYPNDAAFNYEIGGLRGMWVVSATK